MSGPRDESIVLQSIADAAARLVELGNRSAPGQLGCDRDDSEAILWNLVVLGEATKRLSPVLRTRFADVPWTQMAQTRDVVAHRYDGINWVRIGEVICSHLPQLLPRLIEVRDIVRAEFDAAETERLL